MIASQEAARLATEQLRDEVTQLVGVADIASAHRQHVELVLHMAGGNVSLAARVLGVPRHTVQRWRKRWAVR